MNRSAQLTALAGLINQALALDNLSQQRLIQLANKKLRIECTDPVIRVDIAITDNGTIELYPSNNDAVNAHLSGPLSAFIQLLASDDKASAMINSGLQLKGNSQLLLELEAILHKTDLDWEYHLSRLVGDLPAHLIGRLGRHSQQWLGKTGPVFMRHLQEFVLEEAQLSPRRDEVEHFIDEVQKLKLRTERLEARLLRLQQGSKT